LATPINGRKPAYHQAKTSTITKNHCDQREKKINTKENIERDQRKVQYAKQKNYCTPILLHAQDVFPVMFLQEKEARERRHFFL
jgi:predicted RNA-binding protein